MRDSTYHFLFDMGAPDAFSGFDLLGEALDMTVELMRQDKRVYLGSICERLGREHGITAQAVDRAMRRVFDGIVRHSCVIPNPLLDEVIGCSYRWMTSLRNFLLNCASWLLNHEDAEE